MWTGRGSMRLFAFPPSELVMPRVRAFARSSLSLLCGLSALTIATAADPRPVPPETMPPLMGLGEIEKTVRKLPLRFTADFEDGKADVMTSSLVFSARIAQPDDKFHGFAN